ncbi:MAG: E3 binding domain-containing protein, partial [Desulfobacterales bacterium]|nr:E3 binding domain-containing protein [Desulfobacterales bacterium]
MATEINIPKLGMSMKEATLTEWMFNEGDWVEKKAVVLMIETEKVQWEVEALNSGFLHILVSADGNPLQPVGAVVGQLAETEEELKSLQAQSGVVAVSAASEKSKPAPAKSAAPVAAGEKGGRVKISPVAKKMAAEAGIDITSVTGTGPGGRISKTD